jgi:hypothetical protein
VQPASKRRAIAAAEFLKAEAETDRAKAEIKVLREKNREGEYPGKRKFLHPSN